MEIFLIVLLSVTMILIIKEIFFKEKQKQKMNTSRKDELLYELGAVEYSLSRTKNKDTIEFFQARKDGFIAELNEIYEKKIEKIRGQKNDGR
jgi:hypothetical protein